MAKPIRTDGLATDNREVSVLMRLYGLLHREEGATMVEYGLMVALIAVVALAAVTLLGGNVSAMFQKIADALTP